MVRVATPRARRKPPWPSTGELQQIPGIGPSMEQDLLDLGIRRIADLRERDPQEMYETLTAMRGIYQDRCVLYVFRCAIYYAGEGPHDPELLKWWNWKDNATRA